MKDILKFAPKSFGYLFCSGKKVRYFTSESSGKMGNKLSVQSVIDVSRFREP